MSDNYSRIKVLFIISQLQRGGAERQLVELVTGLDKRQFEIAVCSLSEQSPLADEITDKNIKVIILKKIFRIDFTRILRLYKIIKEGRFDIVHCYMFTAGLWGRIAAVLANAPCSILSIRNYHIAQPVYQTIVNRLLLPATSMVICNSYAAQDLLLNRREANKKKLRTIHNGINLEKFVESPKNNQLKEKLSLNPESKVIGIVGRLEPQKDHLTFLKAAKIIVEIIPLTQFLCVGRGSLETSLKKTTKELGIAKNVVFTGERTDIPEVMDTLDVLVLSSIYEGIPNVILEAMASSVPVVATNVGGVNEIVINEVTGFLVEPENPAQIADRVIKLIQDSSEAKMMGKKGRAIVEKNFSRQKMVDTTQALYDEIVKNKNNQ